MKRKNKSYLCRRILSLLILIVLSHATIKAQADTVAKNILLMRGEVIARFIQPASTELSTLSRMMSIDSYTKQKSGNEITAYLNQKEFIQFAKTNIPYEIIDPANLKMAATMCSDLQAVKNWNCYPTYNQYLQIMESFVTNFPGLCKLDTFGHSTEGRKLLAIKISDNVNDNEEEPDFLYTSSVHGDETTGYVLMLRLIDYLLSNYNLDSRISDLVNSTEIWINPLSNPDGTYSGGNSTLIGATRGNSNHIDLNRNYPDPTGDLHPDGAEWQPENLAMIDFMKKNYFVLAANFHGGVEVVNYPWDAWTSTAKIHADDSWYQDISHEYADTVHNNSNNYMLYLDNGVTNGGDWYIVYGSRQDYTNYYLHGRETTIEISNIKTPDAASLPNYWNYNYRSFLNYINQVHRGIYGKVTDQEGNSLFLKLTLKDHDQDSSEVYSNPQNGMYYRMLSDGIYQLIASLPGYSMVDTMITISGSEPTPVNLVLKKDPTSLPVIDNGFSLITSYTNPVHNYFEITLKLKNSANFVLQINNGLGKKMLEYQIIGRAGLNHFEFDIHHLKPGIYFCKIGSKRITETLKIIKTE